MKTKINPDLWDQLGNVPPKTKLAVLWMLTNKLMKLVGYCVAYDTTFKQQTGLSMKDYENACRFFEEEGGGIVKMPKGYWLKSYIREQLPTGSKLASSGIGKSIGAAVTEAHCKGLKEHILAEYPHLECFFHPPEKESSSSVSPQPVPTATKAPEPKREPSKTPQPQPTTTNAAATDQEGIQDGKTKTGQTTEAENAPADKILATLGAVFGRRENERHNAKEREEASALEATNDEIAIVAAYYLRLRADSEKGVYLRQSLLSLLQNFSSEKDKAHSYFSENPGEEPWEIKRKKYHPEPEGWREAILGKYPDSITEHWRTWWEVPGDLRSEFPQFPYVRHINSNGEKPNETNQSQTN